MSLNAVFQGAPTNVPSPGAAAALGLDENSGTLYYTSPSSGGWKPTASGAAANAAAVGGITVTGTPTTGQVLKATSGTAADWQTATTGFTGTIVTAMLTPSTGTEGSITVVNGVITAVTPAT